MVNGIDEEPNLQEDVNDEGIADVHTTPAKNHELKDLGGENLEENVFENCLPSSIVQEQDEDREAVQSGRTTPSGTLTKNETRYKLF